MKYYIAENGQAVGPFEPNELLARGLTVNSLVWGEGMPSWTSASQVPELMAILSGGTASVPGVDVSMPQVPPVGDAQVQQTPQIPQVPQVPPVGGDVSLPQVPPVTTPQPQPQSQPQQVPTTPYGQGGSTIPNTPLPFPQGGNTTNNTRQATPKTWLLESAIATVVSSFCCGVPFIGLIPGFIAIYMGWMSKTAYAKGDIDGANKKAGSAKKWFYITIAVGLAAAVYGGFNTLQNSNITDIINDMQNGNMPFFYGLPK